jgi:hypothetical protein
MNESIRLVAVLMKVRDGKARAKIINPAESYAVFEPSDSLFHSIS